MAEGAWVRKRAAPGGIKRWKGLVQNPELVNLFISGWGDLWSDGWGIFLSAADGRAFVEAVAGRRPHSA
ncbi:hypothetical protein D8B26_005850 [Coccidioides posadasii str. Silveira]|uniref:uncharacterized protein n=1 Tax=Coccidioides posadasii (strain RMSCC 757 / Silveira) TaxID=443226 RepID=UPI001BF082B8|nr:hypothetical protein D8B26_005850 [Coccidioides posadasii str. Silveira]